MHQATKIALFTSKKCKEFPRKHRFLFYHLQHRNNSSSHQDSCIYNRWREHLRWTTAAMQGIFI